MKRWGVFLGATFSLGVLLSAGSRAAQTATGEKATYVGSEVCAGCHQDLAKEWEKLPHTQYLTADGRKADGKGCEECHGPGSKHVAGDIKAIVGGPKSKLKPEQQTQMCLQCHRTKLKEQEWHLGAHAKARLACTSCHDMHHETKAPKMLRAAVPDLCFGCHPTQRAQFRQNSHHPVLEGRMTCLDCHNPHRANTDASLGSAKELCVSCHTDKAGPFAYEHDTDAAGTGDSCLSCHRSHGSPNTQLLRLTGRPLCQQCHFDKVAHNPGSNCWKAGCHQDVHGSFTSEQFRR